VPKDAKNAIILIIVFRAIVALLVIIIQIVPNSVKDFFIEKNAY